MFAGVERPRGIQLLVDAGHELEEAKRARHEAENEAGVPTRNKQKQRKEEREQKKKDKKDEKDKKDKKGKKDKKEKKEKKDKEKKKVWG